MQKSINNAPLTHSHIINSPGTTINEPITHSAPTNRTILLALKDVAAPVNCNAEVVATADVVLTEVVVGVVEYEIVVELAADVARPGAPLNEVAVCVGVGNARVAVSVCRRAVA